MRISDWSSDVCSSDLHHILALVAEQKFKFAILLRLEARRAAQEAAEGQEIMRGQRRKHFPAVDHVPLDRRDPVEPLARELQPVGLEDRKSTRLNSSH